MADVVMENLIGDEIAAIPERLGAGIRPHAYGKAESRTRPEDGSHQPGSAEKTPKIRRFSPRAGVDKPRTIGLYSRPR